MSWQGKTYMYLLGCTCERWRLKMDVVTVLSSILLWQNLHSALDFGLAFLFNPLTLRAEHALLYTVKRLIVRWHAALFMLQHSCGQGSRRGHCEAGDFHANLAFSFLDNTQRPITIYTRARVSLLSSCSLECGPSIIAEKRAVETQFWRRLYLLPRLEGLISSEWMNYIKECTQLHSYPQDLIGLYTCT